MYHLPPPKPLSFTGNVAQNFKSFEQSFDIYSCASGLDKKPKKTRASALLHVAGEDAIKVFNGFTWAEEGHKEDPKEIMKKFKEHCTPLTNVIYERHIFHGRIQHPDEAFDTFYSHLCNLVKTCEFDTLTDDMVRDRIVSGIRDDNLRRRLLREPKLTLKSAVDMCRASEISERQSKDFVEGKSIQAVKTPKKRGKAYSKAPHSQKQQQQKQAMCPYCGQDALDRNVCPARRSTCENCKIKGHWKVVCRKAKPKTMATVEQHREQHQEQQDCASSSSNPFLGAVTAEEGKTWSSEVYVDSNLIRFRADTGADLSVIPYGLYNELFSQKTLKTLIFKLRGADHNIIQCKGYFSAKLTYKGTMIFEDIYVMSSGAALLSRDACIARKIIAFIGEVQEDIMQDFSNLFSGLGKLDGCEYRIKLKPSAQPYSIHIPRRVPLPLMDKVKQELQNLQDTDIIMRVEHPTEWWSPIVVVPKANGRVRLCIDLTRLNDSVLRERHQLPSVDYTLAQMAGARYFWKIDANSGFHQIKLSKDSAYLTTFITPFGRFCFKILPFGISSGPEIFQARSAKFLMDSWVLYA